ncbi:hypothetical protein [Microbacterium capsulatum]|uniref:Uncharacterized protein n=1 Tax=Microbacterium capsulatum TaxID=3041921 RepID=A0ABU0XI01_9MICO|nr:hypothetical protein [Microbacterium sp. ASV81]MDQ4213765.1 hypothetical protein [Microbacterium sp. ASV81]
MEDIQHAVKIVDGVEYKSTHSIVINGHGSGYYVWASAAGRVIELTDEEAARYGVVPFRGEKCTRARRTVRP